MAVCSQPSVIFFFPSKQFQQNIDLALQVGKFHLSHNEFDLSIFLSCGHVRMKFKWEATIMTLFPSPLSPLGFVYVPISQFLFAAWEWLRTGKLSETQNSSQTLVVLLLSSLVAILFEGGERVHVEGQLLAFPLWKTLCDRTEGNAVILPWGFYGESSLASGILLTRAPNESAFLLL